MIFPSLATALIYFGIMAFLSMLVLVCLHFWSRTNPIPREHNRKFAIQVSFYVVPAVILPCAFSFSLFGFLTGTSLIFTGVFGLVFAAINVAVLPFIVKTEAADNNLNSGNEPLPAATEEQVEPVEPSIEPVAPVESVEPVDPEAQFKEGLRYQWGDGVEKDMKQAVFWFEKAADQGHVSAQYKLSEWYNKQHAEGGMKQDLRIAVMWCERAAARGHDTAVRLLPYYYYSLWNVLRKENEEDAIVWLKKACEKGDAAAQCALGRCYAEGIGVEKDLKTAASWYRKAAAQGNTSAELFLRDYYYNGGDAGLKESVVSLRRIRAQQGPTRVCRRKKRKP